MSKHKLNIHYRGSPWGSRTQQHAYCLRYAHSQHIESHLGKKQPQAKIPIAFLFSQLHFNVTSHALFYGGHLVMRCKRCAVQNQEITLRHEDWEIDELKIRTTIHQLAKITFYVLVSARLSENNSLKTLFSWIKISLPDALAKIKHWVIINLPFLNLID